MNATNTEEFSPIPEAATGSDLEAPTERVEPPEHRACRSHAPGERPRGRILDGPSAGRPTMSYAFGTWAPRVCRRRAGETGFEHYVHEGGGAYRYAGSCVDHHEPDDMPVSWDTECGPVDKAVDNGQSSPRCPRCGSPRWVSVSLDGGYTRRAQCVPCGAYHKPIIGPGWKSPRFNDPEAEHPDYREARMAK